jgi:hypothetical protein
VTVKLELAVRPAPFVTVTVFEPLAVALALQEYVCEYGLVVSVLESEPKTVGKATLATPDCASKLVAETSKLAEFEPCGL